MHQVRILREARGWTQQHLAEAAGLSLRTVQRVEAGEAAPSKETLLALSGALNANLEFRGAGVPPVAHAELQEHLVALKAVLDQIATWTLEHPDDVAIGMGLDTTWGFPEHNIGGIRVSPRGAYENVVSMTTRAAEGDGAEVRLGPVCTLFLDVDLKGVRVVEKGPRVRCQNMKDYGYKVGACDCDICESNVPRHRV